MRYFFFVILICQMLCGCSWDFFTGKARPSDRAGEAAPPVAADMKPLPPISGSVNLYEAMARTVFHKLGYDMQRLKTEIQQPLPSVTEEAMQSKALSAGYVASLQSRSAFMKTGNADPLQQTGAELARVWNILDMGILYNYGQTGSTSPGFGALLKHKAFHNTSQRVRNAYYRTASAVLLLDKSEKLLQNARDTLKKSRESFSQTGGTAKEAVAQRNALIENTRRLWRLNQLLTSAKKELAILMNVKPGTPFQVIQPDWQHPNAPILLGPTTQLEHMALTTRPELQNPKAVSPGGVYTVREVLLAQYPNLKFDIDYDGKGASLIYDQNWQQTGMKLAARLFEPPESAPVSQHSVSTAEMGGVTQIQLARQQFAAALEAYQVAQMKEEGARKILSGPAQTIDIQQATGALIDRIRFHLAYAELQNAADKMYASAGTTVLPEKFETMSVNQLAGELGKGASRHPQQMNTGAPMPKPPLKAAQQEPSEQPSALEKLASPQTRAPLKTPAPKPVTVVKAEEIKKTGRQVAKKIEIFRDVVNIYDKPSYHATIIGQGLIGERYFLKGWTHDGWLQIEIRQGSSGWVPNKYTRPIEPAMAPLKAEKPVKTVTTPPKKNTPPPVSAAQKADIKKGADIVTVKRSNIRTKPSLDAPVIYIEEIGARFTVQEATDEWCRIKLKNNSDGWLHKSVVESVETINETNE